MIFLTLRCKMKTSEIVNLLSNNICEVIFTKTDGTERTMKCTLNPSHLPKNDKVTTESKNGTIPIWDIDKSAWRSFKESNLKSIRAI